MVASITAKGYRCNNNIAMAQQNEDTSCCICIDTYKDPRILPCLHMFCIKCLQETGLKANKGPGDEMSCPVCRHIFSIPRDNMAGLPKNSFMERLIQITQESGSTTEVNFCDACSGDNEKAEAKEVPVANTYCIDCKQKLCEECTKFHKKLKLCKFHTLVPISEQHTDIEMTTKNVKPISCLVHDEKVLDVYCADCQTVVCAICFIENHEGHKGFHVNKIVDQFRQELENNIESVKAYSSEAQLKKSELLEAKLNFQQNLASVECDIVHRKEALKEMADKQATSLLEELCAVKQKWSKGLQVEIDDFDAYLLAIESYCSYCQKILTCGSASDICRDKCDLSARAKELKEQSQSLFQREFRSYSTDLCFRKSEFEALLKQYGGNMIGEITDRIDSNKSKMSLDTETVTLKPAMEQQRTVQDNLQLAIESLNLKLNREEQIKNALMLEIDHEKARNYETVEKLKHEQDFNKTIAADNAKLKADLEKLKDACTILQSEQSILIERLGNKHSTVKILKETNDHMKLELDTEKMANKKLQETNDQMKLELDTEKMANNKLQVTNDQMKLELDTEKMANKKLQAADSQIKLDLDRVKVKNNKLQRRMKLNLDREKMASKKLQETNEQMKLELDTEKMANKKFQAADSQIKLDLDREKVKNNKLQRHNDQMKLELDREKVTTSKLQVTTDQMKLVLDTEEMANKKLKAEDSQIKLDLDREKVKNNKLQTHNNQMKLELDREEVTNKALQATNYELKLTLDREKMTNRSAMETNQETKDQMKLELDTENMANKKFQAADSQIKLDLDSEKVKNNKLQTHNDQMKLELDKEEVTNKALQATNDELKFTLDREKMTNKTLQAADGQMKLELASNTRQSNVEETLPSNKHKLRLKLETDEKSSDTLLQAIGSGKLEKIIPEKCGGQHRSEAVLIQTFRTKVGEEGKKPINGLTILDEELFVITRWSSQVDVYDSMNFSFVRDFKVQKLYVPIDVVSCNMNKCLYILDFKGKDLLKEIFRVDPNGNIINVLSSRFDFGPLYITNESNVILTVSNKNRLNEYSPDGLFIRQIDLSQSASSPICHPWHAVKLTDGDFVVSHGVPDCSSIHGVCKVDENGNFKKSLPDVEKSSLLQLCRPYHMTVDRNGYILVADCYNSRVLLLDSDLVFKREVLTNKKHGLRGPERICLDEKNGRIFVADNDRISQTTIWRDGRILVFDL